jgi:hypothetical protein
MLTLSLVSRPGRGVERRSSRRGGGKAATGRTGLRHRLAVARSVRPLQGCSSLGGTEPPERCTGGSVEAAISGTG